MGHSTVLIDIDGKRFLIDPMWSERCSPVGGVGPLRFFDVPIPLEKITRIDGIVISHDHYDHLDESTIRRLAELDTIFYVPLGVGAYLEEWGVPSTRIREFDWWDEITIGGTHKIACTPARHFSGRGFFDKNKTLWASWVLLGDFHRVYFGGDSGMFPGFKEIGDKYGPFDLTMIEIGAYHPNWGEIHMGPESACRAHRVLKGRVLMPIHWGTFELAFHDWDEPVKELIEISREAGIDLLLPCPGKAYNSPTIAVNSEWWKTEIKAKASNPWKSAAAP
jgi:L-ascorbate metabolism protein UlaG (beta-lactamase superfamily)